jgi:hypothetical protein
LLERHLAAAPAWAVAGAELVTTGDAPPAVASGSRGEATRSGRSADPPERRSDAGGAAGLHTFARVTVASPGTDRRLVELIRWGMPPTGPQSLGWRIRRVLLLPLRWIRRARRRVWLEDAVLGELRQALARGIGPERDGDRGRPVVLVCMAGVDHLVARPFVERGEATIAQGALRWLADVRWQARLADDAVDGQA